MWLKSIMRGAAQLAAGTWGTFERLLAPVMVLDMVGSSGPADQVTAAKTIDHKEAMATAARIPMVYVCAKAVAEDIAGRPLYAFRAGGNRATRRAGKRAESQRVEDPIIDRLEHPNPQQDGLTFRTQVAFDWALTGNAYVEQDPVTGALYRLMPDAVEAIIGPNGLIAGWRVKDLVRGRPARILDFEQVLHIRGVSWSSDIRAVYGMSPVEPLYHHLVSELNALGMQADQSKKGRPDVILSAQGSLSPEGARNLATRYANSVAKRAAAFAVGRGVKVTQMQFTPQQLQHAEHAERVQAVILSAFEVTPIRAGITDANFASSKAELRTYWETIRRRARLFAAAWSKLAQPGHRVAHDFSDVEALQVSYNERLERVERWVGLGMTPADAADYEGFVDAPVPNRPIEVAPRQKPRPPPKEVEEPRKAAYHEVVVSADVDQVDEGDLVAVLRSYLEAAAERWEVVATYAAAGADPSLLVGHERTKLVEVLRGAGVAEDLARVVAEDEVAITEEVVAQLTLRPQEGDRLELRRLTAFSENRAERLARHITTQLGRLAA